MAIINFPPIEQADQHGLLAIGGDLEVSSLMLAYSRGIFPWPVSDEFPLAWFSPDPRGVLKTANLHLSRSLKKEIRKGHFQVSFNRNFEGVIRGCAESTNRKNQEGTWISEDIIRGYTQLHQSGHAFSVEVYKGDEKRLAGGLYGAHMGGLFTGESMFYREPNSSKIALAAITYILKELEILWIDTQMVTPVVQSLGGEEIARSEYLRELKKQLKIPHDPYIFNQFCPKEILEELSRS